MAGTSEKHQRKMIFVFLTVSVAAVVIYLLVRSIWPGYYWF